MNQFTLHRRTCISNSTFILVIFYYMNLWLTMQIKTQELFLLAGVNAVSTVFLKLIFIFMILVWENRSLGHFSLTWLCRPIRLDLLRSIQLDIVINNFWQIGKTTSVETVRKIMDFLHLLPRYHVRQKTLFTHRLKIHYENKKIIILFKKCCFYDHVIIS